MLAVLAPGQGAQSPGVLAPWLAVPGAPERVDAWSRATGLDLLRLGTTAGADEVRDTAVAQPLLTAAALLSASAVLDGRPDVVCGHSVGELAALAVAGVLEESDAVRLAAERGRAMARAAALRPTGMSAVLGGDRDEIFAAATRHGLQVATVNGPGQVVLGGPVEGLAALAATPPASARVRPLEVAGGFHTAAMLPAVGRMQSLVAALPVQDAGCPVVANADGAALTGGRELADRLVTQLTWPVRFDRCVERLSALGVTAVVELAPGGTLAGIVRRALPDVAVVAVRTPADLPAARDLAAEPAAVG
ncbi:MAG TPA: ACP S-malonyltransferase [Mycobacteriales bacterium]|nr:ACP S-malonyltransferase [Mycobacteriales bacterium]